MLIRQETERDHETVYALIREAFATAEHRDGNEQDLVAALRKGTAFVPELSLVAEEDGRLVGHILFTKVQVGDTTQLALAPLAVLPEYQHRGVGTALIARGHEIAAKLGYPYSIVLGSPEFYGRSGYLPAERYRIAAPFDVPPECFMAYPLSQPEKPISGTVQYAPEFGIA